MIDINGTKIGAGARPYIIAEVGINAGTNMDLAKRFIEVAAEAGADAVKFQTHIADAEMVEEEMREVGAGDVYDTLAQCEWSLDEHVQLQACASEHGVTFLSTPFSVKAVDLLVELDVPAIKIGSGEMNNRHLTGYAANTGKPLLVSTGMNTNTDVKAACDFFADLDTDYALLYCVSEYPATAADFDFRTIEALKQVSGVPVGLSDHSIGVEAAKAAIGYGANLVEKHFTIDRRLPGPDQGVSIEPEELRDLCNFAKLWHQTDSIRTGLREGEIAIKKWAHHSLVATQTIERGEELTERNVTTKRPGTGIPASRYFNILGCYASSKIPRGTLIKESNIDLQ